MKKMLNIEEIKEATANTEYEFYGIRVDKIKYNTKETANNSHQLFQDPDFDEEGELIYPYIENGIYKGFYDAGELDGTCVIAFDAENNSSIQNAIERTKIYSGSYIHVLGGDYAEAGNDNGEIVISNAEVLLSVEK